MPYRTLDPDKITATAEKLNARIGERFPQSGLSGVSQELLALSRETHAKASELSRPILWLRWLIGLAVAAAAATFMLVGTFFTFDRLPRGAFDFVQGLEAAINTALFAAAGLYALATLEERMKRSRVLKELHALRSLIHIIDMHQLTKDPAATVAGLAPTPSSPKRTLTPGELTRYLDYCSELLSICSKLAALYAQSVNDSGVVEAVNDIENLSTNLSRKIWQKIMLLHAEI